MIGELAALGAAVSWTISAILYRNALLSTKPITANIVRCVCTGAILLGLVALVGKFPLLTGLPAYAIALTVASGVIGLGLGDTLYMMSLQHMGVGRAVSITCTYPLFTLLFAFLVKGEVITIRLAIGAVVIVFGIWFLTREENNGSSQFPRGALTKGIVSAVAAAIAWSVGISMIDVAVTLPETSTLDGALAINIIRVSAVGAFLLASAPVVDRKLSFLKLPRKTAATLIVAGIVALALGWFLLTYSFLNIPEAQAVPISSTSPLFATFSSIIFLHERLTVKNAMGSLVIVVGIFLLFIA